ncbi:TonB-dependent receptor domain-containing protein [Polaromonas sp. YR568]|uniref:TonB-dependent receptor domain-containing protein n=1 Tax=Polaromonas sp. YR568 TaxID=1855301 RepID=UPI00398BD97E
MPPRLRTSAFPVLPRPAKLVMFLAPWLSAAALAQSLAPVTVTATRTELPPFEVPASVDVIDGERLRADGRAQLNLSESLALTPGVLARDRQNQAQDLQLSVRGFGARSTFGVRGVRIYVDGIPATMPDGQGQLSHVDLGSASRVEVLRGPFSALYGNSSGGVVQVFTEEGQGPFTMTPSLAWGSDGFYRNGLKATGSTGSLGYTLNASRFGGDGFRAYSAAQRELANARLDWRLANDGQLTLVANHVDLRADDPLGLSRAQFDTAPQSADPSATQFNTRKTVRQTQLGLVYEQPLGGGNRLRAMVYQGQRATVQYQAIPVAAQLSPLHPGGVIDLNRSYGGADVRVTAQAHLGELPLELVAGLAYDSLRERRLGYQNFSGATLGVQGALRRDEDNRVSSLDPYAQATLKLSPRWTLHAGLRRSTVRFDSADHYVAGPNGDDSGSARYSATLPVAGLLYAPADNLRLYATAGKGFETPTLNETAYRADGSTGLNLGLKPSRSNNLEAGAKWRTPTGASTRLEWSAAVFQTATQDEIVSQTNVGGRSTFQNAGATRRRGLELASSLDLPGNWLVQLSYTWLDARYRDAFLTCAATPCATPNVAVPAGNRIPGIARTALALEAGWRPARGWRGGVEARYLGKVPVNDLNSDAAASFAVAAAHVGYAVEASGWKLLGTLRLDNLLDKKYAGSVIVNEGNGRYFEPAAGRTWLLSLTGSYAF